MTTVDPLIGTLFDGRYQIVERLGHGGMATVYLAEDQELGRRVAIKIMSEKYVGDEQFVERFRREASSAAALNHPNIVAVYDRGAADGTYYIAMELLQGQTLKELVTSRGPSPMPLAISYTRQILDALRFAHRNGVVHRDIKPHNMVVDDDGRVKVTDFGIARTGVSEMTEVGSIIGTAQYLSPEQARGAPVDSRSDLYSVGVVLYELLTGEVPFNGETPLEIAMKHLSEVPVAPSEKRLEISHELDAIVLRALAKDPDDRYASAEEMEKELARVAGGGSVSAETEEAATMVLSGESVAAATMVMRAPAGGRPRSGAPTAAGTSVYDGDDFYVPPVRPRSRWPWIFTILLIAAAALVTIFALSNVLGKESDLVVVPAVEGVRENLAKEKIREAGLTPVVTETREDETVPSGHVISQEPAAGDRVPKENRVELVVSAGRPKVAIPTDIVGKSEGDATSELSDLGLVPQVVRVDSDEDAGVVVGTKPAPGSEVVTGKDVQVLVSKGPKPIVVPNVVGMSYSQAKSALAAEGFNASKTTVDSDMPEGTVVKSIPSPGTTQPKGATITLLVSKGPQTAAVPDVTGMTREEAESALQAKGFTVSVIEETTEDPGQDGIVLDQSPAGSSQAEPGSTVTITVAVFG